MLLLTCTPGRTRASYACFAQLEAKKNHLHIAQVLWLEVFPVEFTSTRTKVTVNVKCRVGRSFQVHTLGTDPSWPRSGKGSESGSALSYFLRSSSFILNKVLWYCKRYFYSMLKQSFLRRLFLLYAFQPPTWSLVQFSVKCSKLTAAHEAGWLVDACEVHTHHRISCECGGLVLVNVVAPSTTPKTTCRCC